jgi:rhomboid family GlyGly-CTERM serine protease
VVGTGLVAGWRRPAVAATLILLLAALVSAAALRWPGLAELAVLDRGAVAGGQWWRLWSGHLLHLDPAHALLNLGALAVILLLAVRQRMLGEVIAAAVLGMPLLSLALLWLDPALDWYAGLSGLLHGLLVIVLARRGGAIAWLLLGLIAFKLVYEWRFGSRWEGWTVITLAHRLGAAAGALWATADWLLAWARMRVARPGP